MSASESRRHDLYNGLSELLSPELTETLMAYLPTSPAAALATKDDVAVVGSDITALRVEFKDLRTELRGEFKDLRGEFTDLRGEFTDLRTELRGEISHLSRRMDRMHLTLLGGFMSIVVTLVAAVFFG